MPFVVIASSRVDAKSPVDDNLMGDIKTDLDYLYALVSSGSFIASFNINGSLAKLSGFKKAVDTGFCYGPFTPGFARAVIKKSGVSGSLSYDIRKHTTPKTPITEIAHQYSASTQSIARAGSAVNTQSIARATSQISTQSITHAKAAANVTSIINVPGTNQWRYNLDAAIDSDTVVGDSIVFAGCTAGANNGTFVIVEKNQSGYNSVVVTNASGVAQTGAAGTAQVKIMSYNFTNPVSTQFAAGESATFASHTTGANNGTLTIYAINQSGNNIWVKNASGATQAGVAGTVDVLRWQYNYSAALSTTDYIVGESALFASHTTGGNNGTFPIRAVNSGGNNLIVYNTAGAAQAGVAGNVNTNRWVYAMPNDPSADVSAGYTFTFASHTTGANNGTFVIKEVNRSGSGNSLVVYNESGVAQAGVAGTVASARKLVKFAADQSAVYSTSSYVEMAGTPDGSYNYNPARNPFQVLQVNRGGGSNYNIVIENNGGAAQSRPAGYVMVEMRSIFNTVPTITYDTTSLEPNQWIVSTSTDLVASQIAAGTPLGLYILSVQGGRSLDISVTLH